MTAFIRGTGLISPQPVYSDEYFSGKYAAPAGSRFACIEPDYSRFIDAKAIRRMSRIIRMGLTSAILSVRQAGIQKPDAIIVGTALGCLEDTVSFLGKMVLNKEELLNPTAFIHSTHNTIASQIALHFACTGYNSTYVHRSLSFESALMDAKLLFSENAAEHILIGGLDELTRESIVILQRLGYYKHHHSQTDNLIVSGNEAGEGAAFFLLSNEPGEGRAIEVKDLETCSFPDDAAVRTAMLNFLRRNGKESVDMILSGRMGKEAEANSLKEFYDGISPAGFVYPFKKLCGEYSTASAFGLYIAYRILAEDALASVMTASVGQSGPFRSILMHNNFMNIHHSFILVSVC